MRRTCHTQSRGRKIFRGGNSALNDAARIRNRRGEQIPRDKLRRRKKIFVDAAQPESNRMAFDSEHGFIFARRVFAASSDGFCRTTAELERGNNLLRNELERTDFRDGVYLRGDEISARKKIFNLPAGVNADVFGRDNFNLRRRSDLRNLLRGYGVAVVAAKKFNAHIGRANFRADNFRRHARLAQAGLRRDIAVVFSDSLQTFRVVRPLRELGNFFVRT